MKEERIKAKSKSKMIASILLILAILSSIILGTKLLSSISFGSEHGELFVEADLEKYINYQLSEQDKGTLVQYNVKQKMESGNTYVPIKNSEIVVQLSQIDGKYPNQVKAIAKATEITNGKTKGIEENYEYDANIGKFILRASNQNEQGEILYKEQPRQEARDEYIILCYYDTYTEENPERDLKVDVSAKVALEAQDDITINTNHTKETKVAQNVGTITSIHHEVEDLYNGYMKSNKINGTNYDTTYQETDHVIISKKEAQEELELLESNSFIRVDQNQEEVANLGNNRNLIYKSSKIEKENLKKLLGEEGTVEILDKDGNILATIDKETQYEEDGTITIQYENEPEEIKIKTSEIITEGILTIENTKEIKSTMTDMANTKIKTIAQIEGMDEEIENVVDIKEAKSNVKMSVNNAEWTNKQQNEITFDVSLDASTIKDNMFKNPEVRIELPSQVEKVVLQNSSIFHNNGLELQEPYMETNANGNIVIVAKLTGAQTAYSENTLDLSTDVKITATIILKKDIESTTTNANLVYTNQYTIDGSIETGNDQIPLNIENYQKEEIKPVIQEEVANFHQAETVENDEDVNIEGLKLEVAPVKGDTNLVNGDTIHAGEYIKYNVKITNTSDKPIENIKILGNVPEGTRYGELIADYEEVKVGRYTYNFDETLSSKEIEIGTLEAGQSIQEYYEVQANDLQEGQTEKEIISNIKAYVGQTEVATYELTNTIKPAEAKVFLGASIGNTTNQWIYRLSVESNESEVTVKLKAPEEFTLIDIVLDKHKVDLSQVANVSEDNVITLKIDTNKEYLLIGYIRALNTTPETEESKAEVTAVANVELNNITYQSNENRLVFSYPSVSISMKSDNEGEEVKYEEEINYEITVTNTGKASTMEAKELNIQVNIKDFLPENVEPVSITYDNWEQERSEVAEDGGSVPTERYRKLEPITEEIGGIVTDSNGARLADIDLNLYIPYQQSVTIQVKTTAGMVYEKTRIENSATVSAIGEILEEIDGMPLRGQTSLIKAKTSNIVAHTILPYDSEETEKPEEPTNPENPDTPDTPGTTEDPNTPNQPTNPEQKYSITGTAWLDENEDGQRKSNEKTLSGIDVMLVDTKNGTTVRNNVKTGSDGSYQFTDLEKGDYVVLFKFDTNQYRVTQFQKNGVASSANSDAIIKEMPVNGETIKVGVIDITNLEASVSSMDIGLVENKICDFKLDKSIKKVTVTTKQGTKQYNYQDQKLAKIEIKAKEIEGATVVIEYKIVVTNEGELPATVGKVIDYLPEGLTFSSELNKNWSAQTNGQLINTSLSNRKMEAGESIELTLIATKKMTSTSTGTFTNGAEIGDITNSLNIKDHDSTPANRVKTEDDYSEAEVILSVSTGLAMYLSIGTFIIAMIGIAVFLAKKHGILKFGKISLFGVILIAMLMTGSASIAVAEPPKSDEFYLDLTLPYYNSFGPAGLSGKLTGPGWCNTPGANEGNGVTRISNYWIITHVTRTLKKAADINFTLERRKNDNDNYNVRMKVLDDNNYRYGPMHFYCDYKGQYIYTVKDGNGNELTGYTVCDENGNSINLSNQSGELTFYLKIPKNKCDNGISSIEVATTKSDTEIITETTWAKRNYNHPVFQDVLPDKEYIIDEKDITTLKSKTKKITWASIHCILDIEKVDQDDPNLKLENVTIKVEREDDDWEKTVVTDAQGKARLENIKAGTYTITEVANENYGYRPEATGKATIKPGVPLKYELENKKETGNLTIVKKDEASGKPIEGFGFKLKSVDGDLEGNNKGKYIIVVDSNGQDVPTVKGTIYINNLKYTDNIEEATEFVTDSDGKIEINNIIIGNYEVIETSTGYYGYVLEDDYITWQVQTGAGEYETQEGQSATVNVTRRKSYNTEKYDPEDNPLREKEENDSISTKIYPVNKKKYIKLSGYVWLDKIDGKTSERNDKYNADPNLDAEDLLFNGIEVRLKDKRTGELVEGLKENPVRTEQRNLYTDIGNNGNGEYLFEDVLIEELENYYVEFEYDGLTYTNVLYPNSDEINQYNEDKSANGNYNAEDAQRSSKTAESEENRRTFNEGFSVIKGKEGQSGEETQTGIRVDAEGTEREDLEYEIAKQGGDGNTVQHATATLVSQGDYTVNEDDKVITQNNTEVSYPIVADTTVTSYNIVRNYDYQPETEQIRFINLGLTEREQPDIGIAKDIQNVKVEVNGKTHVYDYAQRFNNNGFTKDFLDKYEGRYYNKVNGQYEELPEGQKGDYIKYQSPYKDEEEYVPVSQLIFNVGVRYGIKQLTGVDSQKGYTDMSYRRAIYRSDLDYENEVEDRKNELKVSITYQIKMNIAEGNLSARINEIADYYDKRYMDLSEEDIKVGTKLDEKGIPTGDITIKMLDNQSDGDYHKIILDTSNTEMIDGKTKLTNEDGSVNEDNSIFVQFKLTKEAVAEILKEENLEDNASKDLLDNVVEVNSYSIYSQKGENEYEVYAGIDKNSNPGNTNPEDETTYENDTDSSPALRLELAEAREMTGKVFEEDVLPQNGRNPNEIMTGEERRGDGKYTEGEKGIGGVEVTLAETKENEEENMIYKTETISGELAGKGKYGFIKADESTDRVVIFKPEVYDPSKEYAYTYDKDEHGGKDLEEGDFFIQGYIPAEYTLTYTWGDETYTVQDYKGTIYDNTRNQEDKKWWYVKKDENGNKLEESERLSDAIDNYEQEQEAPKGSRRQIDNEIANMSTTVDGTNITRTKMDSTTRVMDISVEYNDGYAPSTGIKYTYLIDDVDFGIVERGRQQLEIAKTVTGVKMTLANGQVIIDATIDPETGRIDGQKDGLTYGPRSDNSIGFVKLEVDSELIQGATVEVEYTIKVENKGEKDYDCKEYYLYGKHKDGDNIENELIKMTPEVYDYLDSSLKLDDTKPNGWEEITKDIYTNTTKYENWKGEKVFYTSIESYYNMGEETTRPDGSKIKEWEIGQKSISNLLTEWYEKEAETRGVRTVKLDSKTILGNSALNNTLAPGGINEQKLYATKLLSNSDEIDLNNDTEIAEITRVGDTGRITKVVTSHIYDRGEMVTITPPTGENKNNMIPIIIGITSLIILGAGVVIIKKKVL